jgi:hypothetical protein
MISRVPLLLISSLALGACDDSQAFHAPHPSLERMQSQERVDPFEPAGMKTPPPDTVARDREPASTIAGDAGAFPMHVDRALLVQGRESFDRICATCHGFVGDGRSVVASRMVERPPPSLHDPRIAALSPAAVFEVVTHGYGLMPGFAHELAPRERWAVVAYIDALRLSRHAIVSELPPEVRRELAEEASP